MLRVMNSSSSTELDTQPTEQELHEQLTKIASTPEFVEGFALKCHQLGMREDQAISAYQTLRSRVGLPL